MLSQSHAVTLPLNGDFLVDQKILLEVSGASKSSKQIQGVQKAYVVVDGIEVGIGHKLPLWLFGFLY